MVEDAAHALGARWRGRRIGAFGNLTAFSFYVTKNVTTIEGGALVTEDPALAARVERLALHGLSLGAWQRFSDAGFRHYEVVEPGFKFNMTDVQASLGLHQLPRLDAWIERRAELWDRYDRLLADLPVQTPPPAEPDTTHARHLYQVTVDADAPLHRDQLLDGLDRPADRDGRALPRRAPAPLLPRPVRPLPEHFPVATAISERTLSLPLSPKVTEADQDDVVDALTELLDVSTSDYPARRFGGPWLGRRRPGALDPRRGVDHRRARRDRRRDPDRRARPTRASGWTRR